MTNEYLNVQETAGLVGLLASVEPQVVIEIGCNTGRTAAAVLRALPSIEKYIGIDVASDHATTLACQQAEVPVTAGLHAASDPRFYLLTQDSRSLTPRDLEPCDAVFIDGDHSRDAVLHDAHLALLLVRPGGIIVFHDNLNPAVEVTQALEHLRYEEAWPITAVENSWLAFRRIERGD